MLHQPINVAPPAGTRVDLTDWWADEEEGAGPRGDRCTGFFEEHSRYDGTDDAGTAYYDVKAFLNGVTVEVDGLTHTYSRADLIERFGTAAVHRIEAIREEDLLDL